MTSSRVCSLPEEGQSFLTLGEGTGVFRDWARGLAGLGGLPIPLMVLPFHTVDGVLKAKILKWFAIPFSSGPRFVRTLHHDLSALGGPTQHGS